MWLKMWFCVYGFEKVSDDGFKKCNIQLCEYCDLSVNVQSSVLWSRQVIVCLPHLGSFFLVVNIRVL